MTHLLNILRCFIYLSSVLITFTFAQQWEHLGLAGERIETIVVDKTDPNIIYAGSTSDFSAGKAGNLFKTTNGGINWDTLVKNITVRDIDIHPLNHNIIFIMGGANGLTSPRIIKTTDGGSSWVKADSNIKMNFEISPSILSFSTKNPETIYCGTSGGGGGLYKSTNGGLLWIEITTPMQFKNGITLISINEKNESNIFVATNIYGELFLTTNDGEYWQSRGSKDELIFAMESINTGKLYLATSASSTNQVGLFFSVDSFNTWNNFNPGFLVKTHVTKLLTTNDALFMIANNLFYKYTIDSSLVNLTPINCTCLGFTLTKNNIYLGATNGIFKSSIYLNVLRNNVVIEENNLSQNYPNPFNPTTEIAYEISKPSSVMLEIFNSMGQLIDRFVKDHSDAGKYSFVWNASTKPSGVYFVRMQAGGYSSAKKMVLMK